VAGTLANLGAVLQGRGDVSGARACYEESLAIYERISESRLRVVPTYYLAGLAEAEGDYERARVMYEEVHAHDLSLGHRSGNAFGSLGVIAFKQGDYERAQRIFDEKLAISRELGDKGGVALALYYEARMFAAGGDYGTALRLGEECLTLRRQLGNTRHVADTLCLLAEVALAQGDTEAGHSYWSECLILGADKAGCKATAKAAEGLAFLAASIERLGGDAS
jgi:tetratricopeptide (TPR) repeat protein